jgi:hypothetical protein
VIHGVVLEVRCHAAPISTLPAVTRRFGAFSFPEGSAGRKRALMLSESVLMVPVYEPSSARVGDELAAVVTRSHPANRQAGVRTTNKFLKTGRQTEKPVLMRTAVSA